MVLSLEEFVKHVNFHKAVINYLQMASNAIYMDVDFYNEKNMIKSKAHIIFKDVEEFTDEYFSPLDKLLSRFKKPYVCYKHHYIDGSLLIDDCIKIKCSSIDYTELMHN